MLPRAREQEPVTTPNPHARKEKHGLRRLALPFINSVLALGVLIPGAGRVVSAETFNPTPITGSKTTPDRPSLANNLSSPETKAPLYDWDGIRQTLSELESEGKVPGGMGSLNESASSDKLKVLKASVERIAPKVENRAQYYQDLIDYTENTGLREVVQASLGNNRYLTYKDKLPFYGEFEELSSEVRTVEDMVKALKQNPTPAQYDKVQERLYQLGYKCPGPIEPKELNNGKITVIDKYNVTNQAEFDNDTQRLKDFIEANDLDFIYMLPADIQITSSRYGPNKVPVLRSRQGMFQIIEKGGNFRYKISLDMDPRENSALTEQEIWAHEIFTALMYTEPYMVVGDKKLKSNPVLMRALPASSMGPLIRSLFEFFESDSVRMGETIPEIYNRLAARRDPELMQRAPVNKSQFWSAVTEYPENIRVGNLENRGGPEYAQNPALFDKVLEIGQKKNGEWLDKNGFLWSLNSRVYGPGPNQDKDNRIRSILIETLYLDDREVLDLFPEEQNKAWALFFNALKNEALGNLLGDAAGLQIQIGSRLQEPTDIFSLSRSMHTYLASR